MGNHQAVSAE